MLYSLKNSPTFVLGISSLGLYINEKLCFTERSLQFSKFTHKSWGSLFSLNSFLPGVSFFSSSTGGAPFPLSLSPSMYFRPTGPKAARQARRSGTSGPSVSGGRSRKGGSARLTAAEPSGSRAQSASGAGAGGEWSGAEALG
jgi:hypothetical protein